MGSGSRPGRAPTAPRRSGPGLIQVLAVACLICGALVFGAGEMAARHLDVDQARELARAQQLLEQTRRAVVAWPEADIQRLDGTAVGGRSDPDASGYRVEYRVREAGGMFKVDAVLTDRSTRREIGRMVAWRGRG